MKIRFKVLRLILAGEFAIFSSLVTVQGAIGIWQDYAKINGTVYDGQYLDTSNPNLSGASLGSLSSIILNGGEVKTYKNNGGNVTGASLFYRVWLTSGGATGSFSFIPMNFGFDISGGNAGDQDWNNYNQNVNLLTTYSLTGGNSYTLEMFFQASGNEPTFTDNNNNSSLNYRVNFSVTPVPEPIKLALPIFGGLVVGTGWARRFVSRRTDILV